jgi:DNA-binding response OmpR family regulator
LRILVLDDYRSHGESLTDYLQSKGHEAIFAESYRDVGWLLDLFRFDLAILDHDMPEASGPAVAAQLAERTPAVRSVIVSAREPADLHAGLVFLRKPVAVEELLRVITAIERERTGSPLVVRSSFQVIRNPLDGR